MAFDRKAYMKEYQTKWYADNRERLKARVRANYYANHEENKAKKRERSRKRTAAQRKRDAAAARRRYWKRKGQLPPEERHPHMTERFELPPLTGSSKTEPWRRRILQRADHMSPAEMDTYHRDRSLFYQRIARDGHPRGYEDYLPWRVLQWDYIPLYVHIDSWAELGQIIVYCERMKTLALKEWSQGIFERYGWRPENDAG